jgi:tetratricopeptide (TPR) repeat protein
MHTIPSRSICLATTLAAFCLLGEPAPAAVQVLGTGMAHACSDAAHRLPKSQVDLQHAIDACDTALSSENLTLHDETGSHINRGVLLVARGDYTTAKEDFDAAIRLMPDLGEGYVDRGAALLGMRRYAEAVTDIDRGLARNTTEPEKAYFDRAVAREALDDIQGAYRDYMRAAELKPDWDQPRIELARFTISKPGGAT